MTVHGLARITYAVPNLDEVRAFYREFGLEEFAPGRFSTTRGGEQLRLNEGPRRRIDEILLGVDNEVDLAVVARRLRSQGCDVWDGGGEVSAVEPRSGIRIGATVRPRVTIAQQSGPTPIDRANLVRRDVQRPTRLGHVVFGTPDAAEVQQFLITVLDMRVSDRVGSMSFLRAGTDHHNVVVFEAASVYPHHSAWKVESVDAIGANATALIQNRPERHQWGLGRHAASANYFWYLNDPAGILAEYYYSDFDDLVQDPSFWDPVPDAPSLPVAAWGPPIPDGFMDPHQQQGARTCQDP